MKLSVLSRMLMEANPCLRWVIEISTDRQLLPLQVNVTLNFGDGTGEQVWSREDPKHLWVHQYQMPGFYWVSVSSGLPIILTFQNVKSYIHYRFCAFNPLLPTARNVYDLTGDNLRLEVEVVDPIVDNMGMEVVHHFSRDSFGSAKSLTEKLQLTRHCTD